ncbi:MAG TPA: hypothetical protein PKC69_01945 [Chitinophagaceae bacterium]|nr:hypothetical protein [Chitinophagaceae bacterium]
MKLPNRDLIVLLRDESMSQQSIDHEVECIDTILRITESDEKFCTAHELVRRNRITSTPNKILKAIRHTELKAFYFLINKN